MNEDKDKKPKEWKEWPVKRCIVNESGIAANNSEKIRILKEYFNELERRYRS